MPSHEARRFCTSGWFVVCSPVQFVSLVFLVLLCKLYNYVRQEAVADRAEAKAASSWNAIPIQKRARF